MIKINSLSFAYPLCEALFSELNLQLQASECVLLQGENGSGKSSLLKLIMGILIPQKGSISIAGKLVRKLDSSLFSHILYHSQNTDDNFLGISPAQDWQLWQIAIPGLPELAAGGDKLFSELSSGEKKQATQRILPYQLDKYWILDEPFAALDSAAALKLTKLLRSKKQQGTGMLIASHATEELAGLIDRSICLQHGKIQENIAL